MRAPTRERTLGAVADLIGARLVGPADAGARVVRGVAALHEAEADQVTFLANPRYRGAVAGTRAAAVILAEEVGDLEVPQLVVAEPYFAYASLMDALYTPERKARGTSPDARVDPTARVGEEPDIGPFATVGAGAVIGARATLHPGVHVGAGCTLGDDVTLYPGVVVRENARLGNRVTIHAGSVIGSDGFGYATQGGVHKKIPHVGRVVVEDDVEIGSNVTIDRAVLGETVVGAGTKIDNQVQVAHNVRIGRGCLIAAQVGLSGSATVGDHVVLAGQVGVAGHLKIGNRARVAGKAGVTKDIPDGQTVSGFPAGPHREQMRAQVAAARLPELRERVAELERRLRDARGKPAANTQGEGGA